MVLTKHPQTISCMQYVLSTLNLLFQYRIAKSGIPWIHVGKIVRLSEGVETSIYCGTITFSVGFYAKLLMAFRQSRVTGTVSWKALLHLWLFRNKRQSRAMGMVSLPCKPTVFFWGSNSLYYLTNNSKFMLYTIVQRCRDLVEPRTLRQGARSMFGS